MVGTMGDEIMPVLLFATLIYWTQQAERERERERNAMEKIQLSGRFSYIVVEKVLQDCMAVGSNSATAGRKDDKEDGKGQYFHKKRSRSK